MPFQKYISEQMKITASPKSSPRTCRYFKRKFSEKFNDYVIKSVVWLREQDLNLRPSDCQLLDKKYNKNICLDRKY